MKFGYVRMQRKKGQFASSRDGFDEVGSGSADNNATQGSGLDEMQETLWVAVFFFYHHSIVTMNVDVISSNGDNPPLTVKMWVTSDDDSRASGFEWASIPICRLS